MSHEIIIIGAGAAGLGAARRLKDAGHDALVLEARDRLGGRAFTRYDLAPFPVEQGAEFLHGENIFTWEFIRRYGLSPSTATPASSGTTTTTARFWTRRRSWPRPARATSCTSAAGARPGRTRWPARPT